MVPNKFNPVKIYLAFKEKGFGRVTRFALEELGFSARARRRIVKDLQILRHPFSYLGRKKRLRKIFPRRGSLVIARDKGFLLSNSKDSPLSGIEDVREHCLKIYKKKKKFIPSYLSKTSYPQLDLFSLDESKSFKRKYELEEIRKVADFALSKEMVQAAACYLGEMPILGDIYLLYTPVNKKKVESQLYHQDGEDYRQCKFFLAIEDVDEGKGPFTFFPANISQEAARRMDYYGKRYKKHRTRVPDEEMYRYIPASEEIKVIGPAGSFLFVDTSRCFHFGSRTRKKPRLMLEIQYVSRFNLGRPAGQLYTKLRKKDIKELSLSDPYKVLV